MSNLNYRIVAIVECRTLYQQKYSIVGCVFPILILRLSLHHYLIGKRREVLDLTLQKTIISHNLTFSH